LTSLAEQNDGWGMGVDRESSAEGLPGELVEAVAAALEQERREVDAEARERIQAGVRATLDGWMRKRVTTAQAVLLLRIASKE
jgi:hypothetical protein